MRRINSRLILGFCLTALPLFAQTEDPGRGVARVSLLNGDVSLQRGDSGDVVAAAVNAPLLAQDKLFTGNLSRAEVQFDYANMIRLGSHAEIRLAELEYRRYLVQVGRGTVTFRILRDQQSDVEISTPSVAVRPMKRGSYRVMVRDDGTSEITVRTGEAEIYTPRGTEHLAGGRTMLVRGTAADPEFQYVQALPRDEWDLFNESRDRDLERSQAYQYVSRDVYGAEDLDANGRWVSDPEYGNVWTPVAAPGWAPYRNGRWAWIDYYGWTWVSYDPWGWAPYHYGRWFYRPAIGWCWFPGAIVSRHYWSPALVAFVGLGSIRPGFGFGNVGWVPLAPLERYYPWYGSGYYRGYRNVTHIDNSVSIVNNINVVNVYRNARVENGITTIPADRFGRSRHGDFGRASAADLQQASVVQGPLPLVPGRDSLRLADRDPIHPVPSHLEDRRFYSRRQPAAIDRVPFEQQQHGVEQLAQRAWGTRPDQAAAENPAALPRPVNRRGTSGANAEGAVERNGWRRLGGQPQAGAVAPATQAPASGLASSPDLSAPADRGRAWRRFGETNQQPLTGVQSLPAEGQPSANVPVSGGQVFDRGAHNQGSVSTATPGAAPVREASPWRRFGDPVPVPEHSAPPAREAASHPRSEPVTQPQTERHSGFTRPGFEPPKVQVGNFSRPETPRAERPSAPRIEAPRPSEPVHVSPAIVREHSSPRAERSSPPQRGGGEARNAPSTNRGDGGGNQNGGSRGGRR